MLDRGQVRNFRTWMLRCPGYQRVSLFALAFVSILAYNVEYPT
jgi:hypothetical protein